LPGGVQEEERIKKKASKTHKEKVEVCVFTRRERERSEHYTAVGEGRTLEQGGLCWCAQELNRYLDTISEHYDIPKVSWTK
jgi:hypothetical protein